MPEDRDYFESWEMADAILKLDELKADYKHSLEWAVKEDKIRDYEVEHELNAHFKKLVKSCFREG